MKLCINVPDRRVIVNGVALTMDVLKFKLAGIHAVHFHDKTGSIEYDVGHGSEIKSISKLSPVMKALITEHKKIIKSQDKTVLN